MSDFKSGLFYVAIVLWGASGWVFVALYHRLCGDMLKVIQKLDDRLTNLKAGKD